jgi:hypothetical protein
MGLFVQRRFYRLAGMLPLEVVALFSVVPYESMKRKVFTEFQQIVAQNRCAGAVQEFADA